MLSSKLNYEWLFYDHCNIFEATPVLWQIIMISFQYYDLWRRHLFFDIAQGLGESAVEAPIPVWPTPLDLNYFKRNIPHWSTRVYELCAGIFFCSKDVFISWIKSDIKPMLLAYCYTLLQGCMQENTFSWKQLFPLANSIASCRPSNPRLFNIYSRMWHNFYVICKHHSL